MYNTSVFCYHIYTPTTTKGGNTMALSDARKRANKKWNEANADRYERINLLVPKGSKEEIATAAEKVGESISQYMLTATRTRMDSEKEG